MPPPSPFPRLRVIITLGDVPEGMTVLKNTHLYREKPEQPAALERQFSAGREAIERLIAVMCARDVCHVVSHQLTTAKCKVIMGS